MSGTDAPRSLYQGFSHHTFRAGTFKGEIFSLCSRHPVRKLGEAISGRAQFSLRAFLSLLCHLKSCWKNCRIIQALILLSFILNKCDILRAYSIFLMQLHAILRVVYTVCAMEKAQNLWLKEILHYSKENSLCSAAEPGLHHTSAQDSPV